MLSASQLLFINLNFLELPLPRMIMLRHQKGFLQLLVQVLVQLHGHLRTRMCVCVCVCARARVYVCVIVCVFMCL